MKLKTTMIVLCLSMTCASWAQTFAPAFQGFSKKKNTYITMKDGTEKTVRIKKFFLKKGLIDDLKVVNEDGSKVKINPADIEFMYIPPSNLAKFGQVLDAATDLTKLQDGELSSEHLDDGYLYMESSQVQVKKNKVQPCMLQVMNPTFSKKITVYNDPMSGETASVGVGGVTVAGGLAKSYYIKKDGEEIAKKIKKKEYKKDMDTLFGECPSVIEKYGESPKWNEFEKFIYDYSVMCE